MELNCKIFHGTDIDNIEKHINIWSGSLPKDHIKTITQSESAAKDDGNETKNLTITIWYTIGVDDENRTY